MGPLDPQAGFGVLQCTCLLGVGWEEWESFWTRKNPEYRNCFAPKMEGCLRWFVSACNGRLAPGCHATGVRGED